MIISKKSKILIIGGGFGGCASAHLLLENGFKNITLIDKSPYLGAGVRTQFYGGHPYTFGPRHFLTFNKKVYDYLDKKVPLRSCVEHQFLTYVEKDNNFYNYPLHFNDVNRMPDKKKIKRELKNRNLKKIAESKDIQNYWINSIGSTLYSKFIENYNKKMWLVNDVKKIDTFKWSPKGATIKKGPRAAWDKAMSAYPIDINGYNKFFDVLKNKKNLNIKLKSELKIISLAKKIFKINDKKQKFDLVISTISPDFFFKYKYGELPFIGRDFHKIVIPQKEVFPKNVYFLYYANNEAFTRIVEYKKFTKHKSNSTLLGLEIPSLNGKHYPVPFKKEIRKSHRYIKDFPDGYFSIGRAGTYRYEVDIDDCIEQAMAIIEVLKSSSYQNAFPDQKWWNYES